MVGTSGADEPSDIEWLRVRRTFSLNFIRLPSFWCITATEYYRLECQCRNNNYLLLCFSDEQSVGAPKASVLHKKRWRRVHSLLFKRDVILLSTRSKLQGYYGIGK